jgi:hypothetical protein
MGDFNWWLLIIGVVAGGLLTWLVLAESKRQEGEIGETELPAEAAWIARTLATPAVDATLAEDVLRAHRRYLGFPPPDVLAAPEDLGSLEEQGFATAPPADLVSAEPAAGAAEPEDVADAPDPDAPVGDDGDPVEAPTPDDRPA